MEIQGRSQRVAAVMLQAARLKRESADGRLAAAGLWREIRAARASQRARELGEDRQIGVQPDPIKPPDPQG